MKRLSHAESAHQPSVTVFEDLHWLDPASELFLANHVEAIQGTQGLTVLNFRPEYHASWMSRSFYRQIALAPLPIEATVQMLEHELGSDPSLTGLAVLLGERAGGNPFFIEELVQALVEAGSLEGERGAYRLVRSVEEAALPATVQAVLAARIDRLAPREKAVLQVAAVVGKEFSATVLEHAVDLLPEELEDALRVLVEGEFVHELELFPEAVYAFKHPLTQEVAYRSQLAERRAPVHAAVARSIEARYPDRLDERAALLAQHWEAAGEPLEAARWHARAAVWSGTSDPAQALRQWGKVRELTDALTESAETAALGLTARVSLLDYGWRLGIPRDEAEALFVEAEQMASRTQNLELRAFLLVSHGVVRAVGDGDLREYTRRSREAIALAEESGDPALYVRVAITTYALFCTGALEEGLAICDRAIELADGDPTVGAGMAGGSGDAWCHVQRGGFLILLGQLDEADRMIQHGRRIAGAQGNIETVGFSHQWSTLLAYYRGDPEAALVHAEQAVEIAERTGSAFSRAWSWAFLGWAQSQRGQWDDAIATIESAMAIAKERRTAAEGTGLRLITLGEAHLGLGDTERALPLIREGLAVASAQGHVFNEVLGQRALARGLLASVGPSAHAEIAAALARALQIGRDAGTRADEPLIRVELAELARRLGDEEGHHRELREAHRLFTEIGSTGHAERLAVVLGAVPG
jgi:adenylate cyclase